MRPALVIVGDVQCQDAPQLALIEDNDVIEAFAADRADHALDIRVLPGRSWRGDDLFDAHRLKALAEPRAIRGIAVAQQIAWRAVPRKGFRDLAGEPVRGGLARDTEVDDLAPIVTEHDEHIEELERDRRDDEHVNGSDAVHVVAQEASPTRRWRFRPPHHAAGDRRLADI